MSTHRVISRPEWGARHANGFGTRRVQGLDKWLHHSVTQAPDMVAPFDDDYDAVRTLEKIGQQRFGGGISYSFPITPIGLIFEGVSIDRIGAHTQGHNTSGVGIVLVGNYQSQPPTAQQEEAIAWLLNHGKDVGWWNFNALTGGHRDTKSTACPGEGAYARIRAINDLARAMREGSAVPIGNPAPPAAVPDTRPRNQDGSLELVIDGSRGPATIGRWQEVMGTKIDFKISPYPPGSNLIRADQAFLNAVVGSDHIKNLTGKRALDVDGDDGKKTQKTRQFWLRNRVPEDVQRRLTGALLAFDGDFGPKSNRVHQWALNQATAGSGRY